MPCDLLDRLAADPAFGLTRQELDALMEPRSGTLAAVPSRWRSFWPSCAPLLAAGASRRRRYYGVMIGW